MRHSSSLKLVRLCSAILASSCLLVSSLPAQVELSGRGRVKVSVLPFDGPNGEAPRKVIIDNLNRTLLIDAGPGTGESYVVSAVMSPAGLSGRLFDGRVNKDLVSKTYTGDIRMAAHQFSDDITEAILGIKGFATSRVAFISSKTGHKELYAMDIDGGNTYALTSDNSISSGPSWSRDALTIAYTSYRSGYPDVYLVKLAQFQGGQNTRRRVAFFPGVNSGPSISPDGRLLALMLSKDGNPDIYTLPIAGGSPTRLTKTRGTDSSPCWSPDGSKIVYNSDERGSVQLFVMAAAGGEPERLVTGSNYSAEPDWSPDGTKIAFTSRIGGVMQISVYDLTTRQTTQITTQGGEDPSWTRNSRHLVYAVSGSLYLSDTVTKQIIRLENNLTGCSEPAVSP